MRATLLLYVLFLRLIADRAARRAAPRAGPVRILLTGTFYSEAWIRAHLGPLSGSDGCARIDMVTLAPLPPLPKVHAIHPPRWLIAAVGAVAARLLTFIAVAVRTRPDVVGGFHLLINGLAAAGLARLVGARSWYFAVGGPAEWLDGGIWGENPYFARLAAPDPVVERRLLETIGHCDLVVTMGTGAAVALRARGVATRMTTNGGGIDPDIFAPRPVAKEFDAVLVARLVETKRVDRFIEAIARLRVRVPAIRAAIVGDGPLRTSLESRAHTLGVGNAITFAGRQDAVADWLARSRVFVLTSSSEGLALSLMEAMMAGLPAVVSKVGDLGDLVRDGENGELVEGGDPDDLADAMHRVLASPVEYARLATAARASALRYTTHAAREKWDAELRSISAESTCPGRDRR